MAALGSAVGASQAPALRGLAALPWLTRFLRDPIGCLTRLRARLGPLFVLQNPLPAAVHHLPELYPDPQRFDPARWQDLRRGPYEYLPFGAGPRTCIGINFANAAMKLPG